MLENPMYLADAPEPEPFIECDACAEKRLHTAAEWRDFHEYAGHGFNGAVWTHPTLEAEALETAANERAARPIAACSLKSSKGE